MWAAHISFSGAGTKLPGSTNIRVLWEEGERRAPNHIILYNKDSSKSSFPEMLKDSETSHISKELLEKSALKHLWEHLNLFCLAILLLGKNYGSIQSHPDPWHHGFEESDAALFIEHLLCVRHSGRKFIYMVSNTAVLGGLFIISIL